MDIIEFDSDANDNSPYQDRAEMRGNVNESNKTGKHENKVDTLCLMSVAYPTLSYHHYLSISTYYSMNIYCISRGPTKGWKFYSQILILIQ